MKLEQILEKVRVPNCFITAGLSIFLGFTMGCHEVETNKQNAPEIQQKEEVNESAAEFIASLDFIKEHGWSQVGCLETINKLTLLVRNDPENLSAYFERSIQYYNLNKYEEAIKDYDTILSIMAKKYMKNHSMAQQDRNRAAKVYFNRGVCKYKLKQCAAAIDDYSVALSCETLSDDLKEALFKCRGSARHELNQFEDALKDYENAVIINPQAGDAYFRMALLHETLGHYEEAIKNYDKVIEFDTKDPILNRGSAYNNRGIIKEKLGRYEEAIEDFKKALENEMIPSAMAKENLARLQQKLKK